MRQAFHKTSEALQLTEIDDAFTEIVADRIMGLARAGETHPLR
jgi:hypothetical protein